MYIMHILFIIFSDDAPSSRIRILNLIPFFEQYGIKADVKVLPRKLFKRYALFGKSRKYDVTVIQKKALRLLDLFVLNMSAKKLVFDFDDAIYCRDAVCSLNFNDYVHTGRSRRFARMIKKMDLVIAANNVLASKAKEVSPQTPVFVLPSSVEAEKITVKKDYTLSAPPVLGWVGSGATLKYLNFIAPALQALRKKTDFKLVVVSNKSITIPEVEIEFVPWTVERQYKEICNFDIGIMPLSPDPFSEGKSSYKLLQYMSCGVPSVCSAVGMNIEVGDNNNNCLCAASMKEFCSKVLCLLNNEGLRKKLGGNSREYILKNFTQKETAEKLAEALKSI